MNITTTMKRFVALAAIALCLAITASAQIDGGTFQIFQEGKLVGEIYVPDHAAGQTLYAEHWVLYSDYVYPSPKNNIKTEIVVNPKQLYVSETDFFLHVQWGTGFRYIHVTSTDTSVLPSPTTGRTVQPSR